MSKTSDTLQLALLAAGAYLLYRLWNTASSAVASVTAKPVTAAAQAYVNLTTPGIQTVGNVILPDGTPIPVGTVNPSPIPGSTSATFSYLGQQYYLNSPSDAAGNWQADTLPANIPVG